MSSSDTREATPSEWEAEVQRVEARGLVRGDRLLSFYRDGVTLTPPGGVPGRAYRTTAAGPMEGSSKAASPGASSAQVASPTHEEAKRVSEPNSARNWQDPAITYEPTPFPDAPAGFKVKPPPTPPPGMEHFSPLSFIMPIEQLSAAVRAAESADRARPTLETGAALKFAINQYLKAVSELEPDHLAETLHTPDPRFTPSAIRARRNAQPTAADEGDLWASSPNDSDPKDAA